MIKSKLPFRIAVSLLMIFTVISFNTHGQTIQDVSKDNAAVLDMQGEVLDDLNGNNAPLMAECPPDSPPFFVNFIQFDSLILCEGSTIYDTLKVSDSNVEQMVTITKLSGPDEFSSVPGNPAYGYFTYYVESAGSFEVTYMAQDDNGDSTIVVKTYIFEVNEAPVITTQDTSFYSCYGGYEYTIFVEAYDADGDALLFYLLSDNAYLNYYSGQLTFYAENPGEYCFTIEVTDGCAFDTAEVCVTVTDNTVPVFDLKNQTFTLCYPDTICFEVTASDPDADDSVHIEQISGPGIFNMTFNGAGTTCFLPENVNSADYLFIYKATDSCIREFVKDPQCPQPVYDTVIITVVMGEMVEVVCPDDEILFLCEPQTIERMITITPSDANVTVIPEGYYNPDNHTISFMADTAGHYEFTVIASTNFECGVDTCIFAIDVTMNQSPMIISAPDTTLSGCNFGEICLPVEISDNDGNIVTITTNIGQYNNGQVCFTPDGPGIYRIITTAVDECDQTAIDTIIVTVEQSSSISIECPGDTSLFICVPETICFGINGIPDDAEVTTWPSSLTYDHVSKTLCFYTNCSINETFKIYASNDCGTDSCSFTADVILNSNPLVILPPDTSFEMCLPEEVCIPTGISDIDNNLESITVFPFGSYNEITGNICFRPTISGSYTMLVTAVDSCGLVDIDSTIVNVDINNRPMVNIVDDTMVTFCQPTEICLETTIFDFDGDNLTVNIFPEGYYNSVSGTVCFTPDTQGVYMIEVTAVDECGAERTEFSIVTVEMDNPPMVVSSPDSSVFLCELTDICFPVSVNDADGNIISIDVTGGGTYQNGFVCFVPTQAGSYTFITSAVDDCGNSDADTTTIEVIVNSDPNITGVDDFEVFQCIFEEICIDVDISDIDENIQSISTNIGYYNSANNQICFTPESEGIYTITLTVADSCYKASTYTVNVAVNSGPAAVIDCPVDPINVFLCEDNRAISYQLTYSPENATITTSFGAVENGMLIFNADSIGTYVIDIAADAPCGSDSCRLVVNINIGMVPQLSCPADTTIELCGTDVICRPVGVIPPEAVITVIPVGTYSEGSVCFDVDSSGHYEISIIAETDCGVDSCTFVVDVAFNGAPDIVTTDSSMFICDPGEITYQISATDHEDDDITYSLISSSGQIDPVTGQLSFYADSSGIYCFGVTASDICGMDTANICLTIDINNIPVVILAEANPIEICESAEQCLEVTINDDDNNLALISTNIGTYLNGFVCFTPDTSGIYEITVTAVDSCEKTGVDTAYIEVNINSAPEISAIENIEMALCAPEELCFDIEYSDIDDNITTIVPDYGYFNSQTGQVCFTPDTAGIYLITIIVSDACYLTAQTTVSVTVSYGETASLACPFDPANIFLCYPQEFCFDLEYTPSNAVVATSMGTVSNGWLCFMADTSGFYEAEVIIEADCGSDTCIMVFDVVIGETAHVSCPEYEELFLCEPQAVERQITVEPTDANVTVLPFGSYNSNNQTIVLDADTAGHYEFTVIAEADCSADTCTFAMDIDFNQPPIITSGDTSFFVCSLDEFYTYDLTYDNPEMTPAYFHLLSSFGDIDSLTGTITFSPDTAGFYCFDIVLVDDCGAADTANICITIDVNYSPVVISAPDTTLLSCEFQEICLPVDIYDVDDNITSIASNLGSINNGLLCFTPTREGEYYLITTVEDACGETARDTTVIDVAIASPFTIECPPDTTFSICGPDTLCFYVGGIPEGTKVIAWPLSVKYNSENSTVCFYTNCSINKEITIYAGDDCNMDSCSFTVDITMNSNPLVIMPPDTTVVLCEPQEVCLPAGISDIDDNIISITTSDGAVYNPISGRVCFTPTQSGDYSIKVRALDECGAFDLDSTIVTVMFNEAPVVAAPSDFDLFLCELEEICFPVNISDPNDNIQSISVMPYGTYDLGTGQVCFTPNDYDQYQLIIKATDDCGFIAIDSINIGVSLNSEPVAILGPDTTIVTCQRETICIPAFYNDVDNNIASVQIDGADYYNSLACLDAFEPGDYEIILTITDSCGAVDADTANIHIIANSNPIVVSVDDFTANQCVFEEICFDANISDADGNIQTISTNYGTYNAQTGQVCFTPDSAGIYTIIINATDTCYGNGSDTTVVTVLTESIAEIACPGEPIAYNLCGAETVCYELGINPENALISVSFGTYENGMLCFNADTSGIYLVEVMADAPCGSDTCNIEFVVEIGQPALATCYGDTTAFLCGPDNISLVVNVIPENATVRVEPVGSYENGHVDFFADTAGIYILTVIAENECGADTCWINAEVIFNEAPVVSGGDDVSEFQCTFEEICFPIGIIDSDNGIDSVNISPVGYYNLDPGVVCFTPDSIGTYCLVITAFDECEATGVDTVCITVSSGGTAQIECPAEPIVEHLCDPSQICIALPITPESAIIEVSHGEYVKGELCFYADTAGTYNITVIATDECGADTCEVSIFALFNEYVNIGCPDLPTSAEICNPGEVSVLVPITPSSATITILPFGTYDFQSMMLTFFADTSGQYEIMIKAETPCGAESCLVVVNVSINEKPQITCPENIDTLICLAEINEICFDVEIIGSGINVTVLPEGTYSGGMVCVPVSEAGLFTATIMATSICGTDTCEVDINVMANAAPELTVPDVEILIPYCENDTEEICIDGIYATDAEDDPLTISMTCGDGEFTSIGDSGYVCFTPTRTDTSYEFCFEVTDGCNIEYKTFLATLSPSSACSLCIDIAIETDSCMVVGAKVPVYLTAQTNDQIGGFDLLISFDASVLSFIEMHQGNAVDEWEYFTYRLGESGDCPGGCPSGILRIVAIADANDGPHHPPEEQLMPQGTIAVMDMLIANDQNLGGLFLPINFYWGDCGDNSFSEPSGTHLYIDSKIYDPFGNLIWDEFDDALFPEESRPRATGAVDSCLNGDKISPVRCVTFHNGGVCVIHPDSIDARGDLNLNGVPYEIADAVVYTNYFIYGLDAFAVNPDGQTAASDVNADGYTLTIADLVYLIRVIIGDADMIPKQSPQMRQLEMAIEDKGENLNLFINSDCPVGAGFMILEYEGVVPDVPLIGQLAEGMVLSYAVNESEIRVLIYSFESGRSISVGQGHLLNIPYNGNGSIRLIESSFATYHGDAMRTNASEILMPREFSVSQNYPNPFNPNTSIELSMPFGGEWEMTIYNINGQSVRHFEGVADPGITEISWDGCCDIGQKVASGIYFYKVIAGEFTETKKMTLLK